MGAEYLWHHECERKWEREKNIKKLSTYMPILMLLSKKMYWCNIMYANRPQNNFQMAGQMSEQSSICPVIRVICTDIAILILMTHTFIFHKQIIELMFYSIHSCVSAWDLLGIMYFHCIFFAKTHHCSQLLPQTRSNHSRWCLIVASCKETFWLQPHGGELQIIRKRHCSLCVR